MIHQAGTVRREVARKVRQLGLAGTVKHGLMVLTRKLTGRSAKPKPKDDFDAIYGTDTEQIVAVGALDIPGDMLEHANRYEAVTPELFDAEMRDLPYRPEDLIFVDIGSGKGRVLLLASRLPFRQVIGVEISEALTEVARNNFKRFQDPRQVCRDLQAICQDATKYEPPHEPALLYMYNPFDEELMRIVVGNVEASLRKHRRQTLVLYHGPRHRKAWDESPSFRVKQSGEHYVLYESKTD